MDHIEALKRLGRDNRGWRLTASSAKAFAAQMVGDDRSLVVLPMRDVWVDGERLPGMKPTVCLSEKLLMITSHPGLFSRKQSRAWVCAVIISLSPYQDRQFEVTLRDQGTVRMRGMIGERRVDEMTERLYETLKSLPA